MRCLVVDDVIAMTLLQYMLLTFRLHAAACTIQVGTDEPIVGGCEMAKSKKQKMSGPDVLSVTLFGGKTMVTVVLAVVKNQAMFVAAHPPENAQS